MTTAYHARRCFFIRSLMLAGILTCSVSLLVLTSSNTAQEPVSTPAVGLKDYIVDDRPDWDGDQKRDLIHSYPSGRVGKAKDVASARGGEVFIHSYLKELGRGNQELIYKLEGLLPGDHFGAVVLSPGDLNFDGLDDLIISAPDHREDDAEAATSAGQVYVMHGRHPDALDLARIDEQNNTIPAPLIQGTDHILVSHSQFVYERFGTQLGIISDADEDGLTDIRVRSEVKLPDGTVTPYTTFFSGATGKPLRTVNGPGEVILWEQIPGDLNQDGLVDMEDLQNVIEAMSGASDPQDDPWGDAASGRSALPRGDVNGDGVIDHNDMLVTLANMDHNRFKFLFPSMQGIDDTGREAARAGQAPCPGCETCVCACFLHFPGIEFHCCCNGGLVCGFCPVGEPSCCGPGGGDDDDDDDDDDPCDSGLCILSMPCDFVRLGGAPVTLNATYTAEGRPDPCGDQWKVEYPSSVRVRRNGAFIFSGSLQPFPIGSLTVEGITVSNACNDVTITFTVLNGGALECEASTTATVYDFDVDVDSDNDGTGVGVRMHDALDTIFPGQLVPLASGDSDSDGVPDWADGMKRWTDPVDPLRFVTSGASLTPMLVYVRPRCAEMKLTFNYFFESDPSFAGLGPPLESATPPTDFSTIARPPDRTRLWSTDIDGSRHWQPLTTPPGPGTFIPAGSTYAATLLGDLVYIEGINPPSELFIIDLTFTGATCSEEDLVLVTVCDIDIDIDSDNVQATPLGPWAHELIEENTPGKLIAVNDNDDDEDGDPDNADPDGVLNDPDLVPILLTSAFSHADYRWKIKFPNTKVALWKNSNGTDPIASEALQAFPMPAMLYAEGLVPSLTSGDVEIELQFVHINTPTVIACQDKVKATIMKIDLTVQTILDNVADGDYDEILEEKPGAFLPFNDDDDDYDANNDPDYAQTGAITDENDLLPIKLKKIKPADLGGEYTLTIPAHVRVWQSSDRSDTNPVSATTTFPAGQDKMLYVEGIDEDVDELQMNWSDGVINLNDAERVNLTVFTWVGPKNVPGYSRYTYLAAGGITTSKWVSPDNGTLASTANPSEIDILWDEGPIVGLARYEATLDFIWVLEVNVVEISFTIPLNSLSTPGFPVQGTGGVLWFGIQSASTHPASEVEIEVTRIKGPTRGVDTQSRGVKFIELGILQNITVTATFSTFPNTNTWSWVGVGGIPISWQGRLILDTFDQQPGPWYNESNVMDGRPGQPNPGNNDISYWNEPSRTTPMITPIIIGMADTPFIHFPAEVTFTTGLKDLIDAQSLNWEFEVYLGARTTENQSSNGAADKYIQRAAGSWRFWATGTFATGSFTFPIIQGNPVPIWSTTGSQTSVQSQMVEIMNGDAFDPTNLPNFNSRIGNSVVVPPNTIPVWTGGTGTVSN